MKSLPSLSFQAVIELDDDDTQGEAKAADCDCVLERTEFSVGLRHCTSLEQIAELERKLHSYELVLLQIPMLLREGYKWSTQKILEKYGFNDEADRLETLLDRGQEVIASVKKMPRSRVGK